LRLPRWGDLSFAKKWEEPPVYIPFIGPQASAYCRFLGGVCLL